LGTAFRAQDASFQGSSDRRHLQGRL